MKIHLTYNERMIIIRCGKKRFILYIKENWLSIHNDICMKMNTSCNKKNLLLK